jgi:hypothetical protein
VEKAFAINAEPPAIWRALTSELAGAEEGAYEVERSVPNELLALWVEVQSGVRALLTYRLVPQDGHTEVVATMEPQGVRYAVFRLLSFGRIDANYELSLAQGLANLKQAVEANAARSDA